MTGSAFLFAPQLPPRVLAQVGSQIESIAEALDRRSPGERTVGELSKGGGKGIESDIVGDPLQQRALGKVFPPPAEGLTQPLVPGPLVIDPGSPVTPLALVSLPPALQVIGGPGGGGFSPPGGGPIVLPPPGGPITSPPVPGPIVTPGPEVPAVPEPSTWLILIVGFALCGAALRRRGGAFRAGDQLPCAKA